MLWQRRNDFNNSQHIFNNFGSKEFTLIFVVCVLSFFNWAMEALKWQRIASTLENISFKTALKATYASISLGFVASKVAGDIYGKLLFSSKKSKVRYLGPILMNQFYQTSIATLVGIAGFCYYYFHNFIYFPLEWLLYLVIVIVLLAIPLFIILYSFNHFNKIKKYTYFFFGLIKKVSLRDHIHLILLCIFRYSIIILQFLICFNLYSSKINQFLLASGISLVLFARSILVSINIITDLSIREIGSMYFLENIGLEASLLPTVTLFMWLINLVIPGIIGIYIISKNAIHPEI